MPQETVRYTHLLLLKTTSKAYLVRDDEDNEEWIPRSMVLSIDFGDDVNDPVTEQPAKIIWTMEIPKWLADQKELIQS